MNCIFEVSLVHRAARDDKMTAIQKRIDRLQKDSKRDKPESKSKKRVEQQIAELHDQVKRIQNQKFAMKVFKAYHDEEGQRAVLAEKEIDILKKVQTMRHPNLVQYIEEFGHGTSFYLVMEYITNGDLSQHIKHIKGSGMVFAKRCVVEAMKQISSGVRTLHSHRIVHRDMKPANILVNGHGSPSDTELKITDFGLARQMGEGSTHFSSKCGTHIYMANEAHQGRGTEKSDVWSLGCILYEMAYFFNYSQLVYSHFNLKQI